jgi:hypothetical protein
MRELKLTTVITTDGHFSQVGFDVLPAADNERMRASQRSRAKYLLATVSAYGPDNLRATKLVVGILRHAGQERAPQKV